MSKKKEKKAILQQQKTNVFRDRKGRIYYLNPKNDEVHRVVTQNEGFIYIYDAVALFSLLPLTLGYAILKIDKLLLAVISITIYIGITVFYHMKLKELPTTTTIPEDVEKQMNSIDVLKARRNDLLLKFTMAFLVIIIIITDILNEKIVVDSSEIGIILSLTFAIYVGLRLLIQYYKTIRKIRQKR